MKALKFWRLCLQTYYSNGDTCEGCILAERGVCERLTVNQIARTRYAITLKRFVAKKEKERREEHKKTTKNTLSKVFDSIEEKRAKNEKRKNNLPHLPEMQRRFQAKSNI